MRIVVVLPEPEGPISTTSSPAATSMLTSSTALISCPPELNTLQACSSVIIGALLAQVMGHPDDRRPRPATSLPGAPAGHPQRHRCRPRWLRLPGLAGGPRPALPASGRDPRRCS